MPTSVPVYVGNNASLGLVGPPGFLAFILSLHSTLWRPSLQVAVVECGTVHDELNAAASTIGTCSGQKTHSILENGWRIGSGTDAIDVVSLLVDPVRGSEPCRKEQRFQVALDSSLYRPKSHRANDQATASNDSSPLLLPSCCYLLLGQPTPGKLDVAAAAALGVPRGPLFSALQRGEDIST